MSYLHAGVNYLYIDPTERSSGSTTPLIRVPPYTVGLRICNDVPDLIPMF